MHFRNSIWATLAGCCSLVACSLTVDASRQQCVSNDDCKAYGNSSCSQSSGLCEPLQVQEDRDADSPVGPAPEAGPPDGFLPDGAPDPWACLARSTPPATEGGPFQVTVHMQDLLAGTPHEGVKAQLCRKIDVECENPDSEELSSDANGDVTFTINRGFSGYVQMKKEGLLDGLYFFNPPVRADGTVTVQVVSPGVVDGLTKVLGAPQSPDLGLLLINALNCAEGPAAGVTFSTGSDDVGTIFYAIDGLPATTATATDSAGYGGLVNATPGTITFTGTLEADERHMGTMSLIVRAGAITYSRLVPDAF